MKIKLLFTFLLFFVAVSNSYASFPVKRAATTVTENTIEVEDTQSSEEMYSPAAAAGQKSQGIALLLWFFLGGLAGHRWYLGSPWYWNILFILTLGGLGIWWIVDLIDILTGNYPAKGGFKSEFF